MEMRPARFHSDPPIAQDIWLRRPSLTWSTLMNTPSICGQMIAGRLIWINIDIEADTRTRRSSMAAIDWTQQSPNLCTISCCSEIFHFFKLQLVFFIDSLALIPRHSATGLRLIFTISAKIDSLEIFIAVKVGRNGRCRTTGPHSVYLESKLASSDSHWNDLHFDFFDRDDHVKPLAADSRKTNAGVGVTFRLSLQFSWFSSRTLDFIGLDSKGFL